MPGWPAGTRKSWADSASSIEAASPEPTSSCSSHSTKTVPATLATRRNSACAGGRRARREATRALIHAALAPPAADWRSPWRGRVAELLDEQRAAAGLPVDFLGDEGLGGGQPGRDRTRALVGIERLPVAGGGPRPVRASFSCAGRVASSTSNGSLFASKRLQRLAAGVVGPLPVVQDQHQGPVAGQHGDQVDDSRDQRWPASARPARRPGRPARPARWADNSAARAMPPELSAEAIAASFSCAVAPGRRPSAARIHCMNGCSGSAPR